MHGANHASGGPDPIPGGGRVFGAGWSGPYPLNILTGSTWQVPLVSGGTVSFSLESMRFRLETPGASSTTVHVERSNGGTTFTGSTVGALTLAAGTYETSVSTALGTVTSGDLLRIVWDAVGSGARGYLVFLEGGEA